MPSSGSYLPRTRMVHLPTTSTISILLSDTPVDAHDRAIWFSHYCDSFRDRLPDVDPHSFPHTDPVLASVSRILRAIFPRYDGPCLEQDRALFVLGAACRLTQRSTFVTLLKASVATTQLSPHFTLLGKTLSNPGVQTRLPKNTNAILVGVRTRSKG